MRPHGILNNVVFRLRPHSIRVGHGVAQLIVITRAILHPFAKGVWKGALSRADRYCGIGVQGPDRSRSGTTSLKPPVWQWLQEPVV